MHAWNLSWIRNAELCIRLLLPFLGACVHGRLDHVPTPSIQDSGLICLVDNFALSGGGAIIEQDFTRQYRENAKKAGMDTGTLERAAVYSYANPGLSGGHALHREAWEKIQKSLAARGRRVAILATAEGAGPTASGDLDCEEREFNLTTEILGAGGQKLGKVDSKIQRYAGTECIQLLAQRRARDQAKLMADAAQRGFLFTPSSCDYRVSVRSDQSGYKTSVAHAVNFWTSLFTLGVIPYFKYEADYHIVVVNARNKATEYPIRYAFAGAYIWPIAFSALLGYPEYGHPENTPRDLNVDIVDVIAAAIAQ